MERLSDKGFQRKTRIFVFNELKAVVLDLGQLLEKYNTFSSDQNVMSVNCSVDLWRDFTFYGLDAVFPTTYVDLKLDRMFCWSYEFVLSTELAKLDGNEQATKSDLIVRLSDFFHMVLPFARLGAGWMNGSKLCVAQRTGSEFGDDLRSYDIGCAKRGLSSVSETVSELALSKHLFSFERSPNNNLKHEEIVLHTVRSINRDYLKGREIRHVVYSVPGGYVAKSVIIRSDGTSAVLSCTLPREIVPERVDSLLFSNDPRGWIFADPVPGNHFALYGLPTYNLELICRKTNIPVVIDDIFNVVLVKHGYVRSTCSSGCACCYVYDNIVPCGKGFERMSGALIYMSPSYLDQYLSNYNRLHSREHLHFVMLDLLQ